MMRILRRCLLAAALTAACATSSAPRAPVSASASPLAPAPGKKDPEGWRSVQPKPGEHTPVQFPTPALLTLKNGLTLYVVPKHSAVATLTVVVRHGSAPAGKSGLAALTARMLTESTQQHTSLALAEAAESLGSTLDADAGRDESNVSLSTLTADVPRGLELLAEVVFRPAFSGVEFQRVKAEWLDGLRAERQEPARLASLVAFRSLLGTTAGAPVSGSISDVQKLTVADLSAFHARAYAPTNMAVIVVGDLTLAQVEPDVERLFGHASGPAAAPPSAPIIPQVPSKLSVLLVDRKDSVQSAIFAVQAFPRRSEPGFEAREIMGTLLGGLFTSRLNLNLREKHAYTYGVHGQALATRQWGCFFVASDVKSENTADALFELLAELERIRDPKGRAPIEEQEVARASTDLMHGLGARLEHTSAIAEAIGTTFAEQLPADYYSKYPSSIGHVPLADVAAEASRIDTHHLLVVIVGDSAQVAPALKQHGFDVETADPKLLD